MKIHSAEERTLLIRIVKKYSRQVFIQENRNATPSVKVKSHFISVVSEIIYIVKKISIGKSVMLRNFLLKTLILNASQFRIKL